MNKKDVLLGITTITTLVCVGVQTAYCIADKLRLRKSTKELQEMSRLIGCVHRYVNGGHTLKEARDFFRLSDMELHVAGCEIIPDLVARGLKNNDTIEKIADDACSSVESIKGYMLGMGYTINMNGPVDEEDNEANNDELDFLE